MSDTTTQPGRVVDGRPVPAAGTWTIDTGHSSVEFVGRHLMVSKVRGRFTDFEGAITIAEKPEDSSVVAVIKTASVESHDAKRDEHLRSPDFFDVENYPTLEFRSTKVVPVSETEWRVLGDLSVKGESRPVTLDVEFNGASTAPWGQDRIGFSASTELDREDWGLTWNMVLETGGFLVGKKIKIEIEVEAVQE